MSDNNPSGGTSNSPDNNKEDIHSNMFDLDNVPDELQMLMQNNEVEISNIQDQQNSDTQMNMMQQPNMEANYNAQPNAQPNAPPANLSSIYQNIGGAYPLPLLNYNYYNNPMARPPINIANLQMLAAASRNQQFNMRPILSRNTNVNSYTVKPNPNFNKIKPKTQPKKNVNLKPGVKEEPSPYPTSASNINNASTNTSTLAAASIHTFMSGLREGLPEKLRDLLHQFSNGAIKRDEFTTKTRDLLKEKFDDFAKLFPSSTFNSNRPAPTQNNAYYTNQKMAVPGQSVNRIWNQNNLHANSSMFGVQPHINNYSNNNFMHMNNPNVRPGPPPLKPHLSKSSSNLSTSSPRLAPKLSHLNINTNATPPATRPTQNDDNKLDYESLTDVMGSVGVDLKEESENIMRSTNNYSFNNQYQSAHFIYNAPTSFLNIPCLRAKLQNIMKEFRLTNIDSEVIELISLALEQKMEDYLRQMILISKHREKTSTLPPPPLVNGKPLYYLKAQDNFKAVNTLKRMDIEEENEILNFLGKETKKTKLDAKERINYFTGKEEMTWFPMKQVSNQPNPTIEREEEIKEESLQFKAPLPMDQTMMDKLKIKNNNLLVKRPTPIDKKDVLHVLNQNKDKFSNVWDKVMLDL